MARRTSPSLRGLLLTRRGLVSVEADGAAATESQVRAIELELAGIGFVISQRLRTRLAQCSTVALAQFCKWVTRDLLAHAGGGRKHTPLFRHFPNDIPEDTGKLWWDRVLVHFLQGEGQPCLFCRRTGTTHVLNPCRHVVCALCFDGSNYSACPICHHHTDRNSPFLEKTQERGRPVEQVTFRLLDLAPDFDAEVRGYFTDLCGRTQALSPTDRETLIVILKASGERALGWLPEEIPLRENIAVVFGVLAEQLGPGVVMPHARRYMTTATDVLRLIAVFSGTEGALQPETILKTVDIETGLSRFWGQVAQKLGAPSPGSRHRKVSVPVQVKRFRVAKLSRGFRRELLGLLESMSYESLVEDMLRHQSWWVWVGRFLHPHEYASRFPQVARAFKVIRKKAPDGARAPIFRNWYSQLDRAVRIADIDRVLALLVQRPGEFGRRYDHTVRLAGRDADAVGRVVSSFLAMLPEMATPLLLTLRSHLSTRHEPAAVRVYWPKGRIAKGVGTQDRRSVLPEQAIGPVVEAITAELLARFSQQPAFEVGRVDTALASVMVPFNERTASASAVTLPRGSVVTVPKGKTTRLFLHWCEPNEPDTTTDLDLSVAMYDAAWGYVGVCSYYELLLKNAMGDTVAKSAGDLVDAPWPEGASEFVDLHEAAARAMGARYAVMVINSFAGLPFSALERAFAGLMFRDDTGGQHFDPRTAELCFELDGENGIFMPLVLDLEKRELHWLDVQSKGELLFNNVATSNADIAQLCPRLMKYFASGARPTMFDLAVLHLAARCRHVSLRDATGHVCHIERHPGEKHEAFHARLCALAAGADRQGLDNRPEEQMTDTPLQLSVDTAGKAVLAFLLRGDVDLPDESQAYALFREQIVLTVEPADLLA